MSEIIKKIFRRCTRKRLAVSREIGPFNRVFEVFDLFVIGSSNALGCEFYGMLQKIYVIGDTGVFSFTFAGVINFIPMLCYMELSSVQPCMGGPYHFSYSTTNEAFGFFIGWNVLLNLVARNAFVLQEASRMLDKSFFEGYISAGIKEAIPFTSSTESWFFAQYPDVLAFITSVIFSGIVAADTGETKALNSFLFLLNYSVLASCMFLFVGIFWTKRLNTLTNIHYPTLFTSCLISNATYSGIFYTAVMGEESINPETNIPKSMVLGFMFIWSFYTIVPFLVTSNTPYATMGEATPVVTGFKLKELNSLLFINLISILAALYSSCFVNMLYLVRVAVSMGRDGLIWKIMSKVEHFNRMPVKPSFICGLVSGIMAVVLDHDLLQDVSSTGNLLILLFAPTFVLMQRYMFSIEHLKGRVERKGSGRPKKIAQIVVLVLTVSCIGLTPLINFLITRIFEKDPAAKTVVSTSLQGGLILFFILTVSSLVFLIIQPQNRPLTNYRLWGVPYTPVIGLISVTWVACYASALSFQIIFIWSLIGYGYYLGYSIWHTWHED